MSRTSIVSSNERDLNLFWITFQIWNRKLQLLPERREVVQPCKRNCVVLEFYKRLYVATVAKYRCIHNQNPVVKFSTLTLILRRSRTGTVRFYTSTSNKRAARPKLYTKSPTRELKRMYSRFTLVRISINL